MTAVLLLHGQPGGIRDWDRVIAALGADLDVIAEYRPGWDGVNPPLDLRGNAEDAIAKLDRHGVDRAVIVGHSLGAGVAAWIAVLHPERVRALVLASPGANSLALDWFDRVLASTVVGPALSAVLLASVGGALASSSVRRVLDRRLGLGDPFMRAGSRMLLRPTAWRSFVFEQRALFRDLPALEARLGQISAPTTVDQRHRRQGRPAARCAAARGPDPRRGAQADRRRWPPPPPPARGRDRGDRRPLHDALNLEPARAAGRLDLNGRADGLVDERPRDRRFG